MKHFFILIILVFVYNLCPAQIQIVASDSAGCAPIQVNFSLAGSLPPNLRSQQWSSNGTAFSNQAQPSRIFSRAGNYSLEVLLTFADGSTQRVSMAVPIRVFEGPSADFIAQSLLLCKDESVQFVDRSTAGSSPLAGWIWAFGDGTIDSSQAPIKRYNQGGLYSVSLQAIDANGSVGTAYKRRYVEVRWPDASFTGGPTSACNSPHSPIIQAGVTGPGFTHQWDLGNGSSSTGPSAQPTYLQAGSFSVTHVITDPSGCTDTIKQSNFINIGNNKATITASDTGVCHGDTVFLHCNSTSGQNIIWDLNGRTSRLCDPYFTANNAGTYMISLEMTVPGGCVVRDTQRIVVTRPGSFFIADTVTACAPPLRVQFNNLAAGTQNLQYRWSFGDGATSTAVNPQHIYQSKGKYTVKLVVTDSIGCRAGYIINDLIQIGPTSAEYKADPSNKGCKGLRILFSPEVPAQGSHLWVFGDGDSSRHQKPQHVYPDTGIFVVKHFFTDTRGCTDSVIGVVEIGDSVQAAFTLSDSVVCINQPIHFLNRSPSGFDSEEWDFGGFAKSTETNPIYTFADTGYHYVKLKVSDRGCADSLVTDSAVFVRLPIAQALANRIGCDTPHTVFFRDSSLGAQRYWWDFGTGKPADTSSLRDPVFTYTNIGSYPVTHIIWNDSTGCSDTTTIDVVVEVFDMRPGATATAGCRPLTVQFQDSSVGAVSWHWEFGPDDLDSIPNPVRTFSEPGPVLVTAIFSSGGVCRLGEQFKVDVYGPVGRFFVDKQTVCAGQQVQFSDSSSSYAPIVQWFWDFGEGNTSTLQHPSHRYSTAGNYPVTLIVFDSLGCSDTLRQGSLVYVSAPMADYLPSSVSTCTDQPVVFQDRSVGQSTLSYTWDFGDGNMASTDGDQQHQYRQNGNFLSKLTIIDSAGCSDSLSIPIVIQQPNVSLSSSSVSANCPPLLTSFNARIQSSHSMASWQWDFGDGNGSTVQNPSHQYIFPGNYQVSLITTTTSGCIDTFRLDSAIRVRGPRGMFEVQSSGDCLPVTVSGTAQVADISTNAIDFGDGTVLSGTPRLAAFSHTYTRPGTYSPVMILDDGMGCRISVNTPDSITVLPKPEAAFEAIPLEGCLPLNVFFSDQSISTNKLIQWRWSFGDGAMGSGEMTSHEYKNSGVYDVQLEVEDEFGCKDSMLKEDLILVASNNQPSPPILRYVTVTSDTEIGVVWERYTHDPSDFETYILEQKRGSNWIEVFRSNSIDDTSFLSTGLHTKDSVYCYRLLVQNACKRSSDLAASVVHCSIQLEAKAALNAVQLDWNAYRGWPNVDTYQVYRVSGYDLVERRLIASLPGESLHYLDTAVSCFEGFSYRIEAQSDAKQYSSWSNVDEAIADHQAPDGALHLVRATVIDDSVVQVSWETAYVRYADRLVLERLHQNEWEIIWQQPYSDTATTFLDAETLVDRYHYRYRAQVTDSCGTRLAPGRAGQSILLQAKRQRNTNHLRWTAYEEWEWGVMYYEVLLFDETTQSWQPVGRTNADARTFEDSESELPQEQYCYMVRAIEMNGNDTISYSNEICLAIDPRSFPPTAFSPNGDGYNDFFLIPTTATGAYKLEIFNRWGNKIFESSKPNEGWDGTYKGSAVPEGVYVWKSYITKPGSSSADEQVGTVTLIR